MNTHTHTSVFFFFSRMSQDEQIIKLPAVFVFMYFIYTSRIISTVFFFFRTGGLVLFCRFKCFRRITTETQENIYILVSQNNQCTIVNYGYNIYGRCAHSAAISASVRPIIGGPPSKNSQLLHYYQRFRGNNVYR